nr:MAG TPA: hypothetical protein [Caudoviricetes sp.]
MFIRVVSPSILRGSLLPLFCTCIKQSQTVCGGLLLINIPHISIALHQI